MATGSMKIIVIAGGGRRVGKTTLAKKIKELLPGAEMIKLGTHQPRDDKPILFLPHGSSLVDVKKKVGSPKFLIIESGSILDDPDLDAHLVIFLPTADPLENKPGSERRRKKADIVRGESVSRTRVSEICSDLDLRQEVFEQIAKAVGVAIV